MEENKEVQLEANKEVQLSWKQLKLTVTNVEDSHHFEYHLVGLPNNKNVRPAGISLKRNA